MKDILLHQMICFSCNSIPPQLQLGDGCITCESCGYAYPIYHNIPIFIDERSSIFLIADFAEAKNLYFDITKKGRWHSTIANIIPSLGGNNVAKNNFIKLSNYLLSANTNPKVLVLGGSIAGEGMMEFLTTKGIHFVESDVSFGPRTQIVLDAHRIPYQDNTFDCVIAQAVLEHVINPFQCVEEIYRVLKQDGFVYIETPFMQQVHGGAYDFMRFTKSGHRLLFKKFKEVESGSTAGPGTVLAWSYEYFLLSLLGVSKLTRLIVKLIARLTGFWLKYLDFLTIHNKYSQNAASGYYFIGKKSGEILSDKEIIKYYNL